MQAGSDKQSLGQSKRALEPDYLLRLFFACPPQGFHAEYAPVSESVGDSAAGEAGEVGASATARGEDNQAENSAAECGAGADESLAAGENGENLAASQSGANSAKLHVPLFSCPFSLLTALDDSLLARLSRSRFYPFLSRLLTFRTLFCGATVTEFLPLPQSLSPAEAERAARFLRRKGKSFPFIIAKDLPAQADALTPLPQAQAAQNFACALEKQGFISVEGQALAYVPIDFADSDAYLARLSKARRKDFRRKLRAQSNLRIDVLRRGDPSFYDEAQLALYHSLYAQVYAQSLQHFDYLTPAFFRALLQEADDSLRFITYREESGRLIGYNICFALEDALIDKYIGMDYPAALQHSLYFVSWFYNLSYAKAEGLSYYVAGWTDKPVKAALGAKFTMTRHMVYIRNPLLRFLLRRCRFLFEGKTPKDNAPKGGDAHA